MVLLKTMMSLLRQTWVPVGTVRQLSATTTLCTPNKERRYTRKHEWVSVVGQVGTIGISDYAQESLGEVVFVQLPDVDSVVGAGEECGALESVKAASEIYSPVSGKVTEKNTEVESSPAVINESCFARGWLFRVELSKPDEVNKLMDQTQYDNYLKEQDH